jgi:hypothetical protein
MSIISILERRSYFLTVGDETLDPSRPEELEQIATYLSTPEVAVNLVKNGHAEAVAAFLKVMSPEQQAAVISVPGVKRNVLSAGVAAAIRDVRHSWASESPRGTSHGAMQSLLEREGLPSAKGRAVYSPASLPVNGL